MIRVGLLLALVLLLAGGLLNAPAAEGHPGPRDDSGCHTCQANCADYGIEDGLYHRHDPIRACDGGSSAEPPPEPEAGTASGPEAGAAAEPQAGSQAPVAPIQPPPDGKHTVEPGDTLYGIANRYGLSAAELLALNPPLTLESIIQPGDVLVVAEGTEEEPAAVRPTPEATHTVEPGDTLYGIADRYGLSAAELLALNPELTLESIIHPGDVLVVAEATLEEPAPSLPEPAPMVESAGIAGGIRTRHAGAGARAGHADAGTASHRLVAERRIVRRDERRRDGRGGCDGGRLGGHGRRWMAAHPAQGPLGRVSRPPIVRSSGGRLSADPEASRLQPCVVC